MLLLLLGSKVLAPELCPEHRTRSRAALPREISLSGWAVAAPSRGHAVPHAQSTEKMTDRNAALLMAARAPS